MKKQITTVIVMFLAAIWSEAETRYVASGGGHVFPYTNWPSAATNIQDAINAAAYGDNILVSNGTYSGISVTTALNIQSVNGPKVTTINGHVELNNFFTRACWLEGFTITGAEDSYGAGVDCSYDAVVRNCIITGNHASRYGGGARCYYGGTLENCVIKNNSADQGGGGVYFQYGGEVRNCTITGNTTANNGGGLASFGAGGEVVVNSIIYFNSASCNGPNFYHYDTPTYTYSCTTPAITGAGNISDNPRFVIGSYRLQSISPCIDRGTNFPVAMTDIDGIGRPLDGDNDGVSTLDIGASEFVHALSDSDGDGLVDTNELFLGCNPALADTDGDRMLDGQEVFAGTNPNNPSSFLGMECPILGPVPANGSGIIIQWQSVTGRFFRVVKATDLAASDPFSTLATGIAGQVGSTQFTDITATAAGPYIYRVEIDKER